MGASPEPRGWTERDLVKPAAVPRQCFQAQPVPGLARVRVVLTFPSAAVAVYVLYRNLAVAVAVYVLYRNLAVVVAVYVLYRNLAAVVADLERDVGLS